MAIPFDVPEFAPLPFTLNGSYDWLRKLTMHRTSMAFKKSKTTALHKAVAEANVALPDDVKNFFNDPSLASRLRSTTDCFINFWDSFIAVEENYLIQFLSDSQGACHWYVFVASQPEKAIVLWSYEFCLDDFDPETDKVDTSDFVVLSESFEAFICRFWLDNEIGYGDTPEDIDAEILEHYPTM